MSFKIAVIGSGISGLTSAYILSQNHDIHLFEARDRLGGHTHTISLNSSSQKVDIDCGFIVFNKQNYPNFTKILEKEQVPYEKSEMSFSFFSPSSNFYYNGHTFLSLFCDAKNIVSIPFYRMLYDILSFNIQSKSLLANNQLQQQTLRDYLKKKNYSALFLDTYLIPMISAIWSCPKERALDMPISFLLNFYQNHGLLNIFNRPQWYVIKNGSQQYISYLTARYKENIHLSAKVSKIRRTDNKVVIYVNNQQLSFDKVVIAVHGDDALKMLEDPTPAEQAILGSIMYEKNNITLHSDIRVMPPNRKAWASWNYYENNSGICSLNYYANRLQNLSHPQDFIVSVNLQDIIAQDKIHYSEVFFHPIMNQSAINAQREYSNINAHNNTLYCGAYWGNGFHEDGVVSAQRACAALGAYL